MHNIVILSKVSWFDDTYQKSTVELAKALAKNGSRVIFIDYTQTVKEVLTGNYDNKGFKISNPVFSHDVEIFKPFPILPYNFAKGNIYEFLRRLDVNGIANLINGIVKKRGFEEWHLINAFNPRYWDIEACLKKKPVTNSYYCYDDITQGEWISKHGKKLEDKILKNVDHAFFSSLNLYNTRNVGPQTVKTYLPNGVDFDLFYSKIHPKLDEFTIAGFVGSLDFRLDYDLLIRLAKHRPDIFIQLIGRISDAESQKRINELQEFPNVQVLPPVDHKQVPAMLRQFDVGLLPYKKNKFTESVYPLKLHEYWACGLPVISTRFSKNLNEFENDIFWLDGSNIESSFDGAINEEKKEHYQKLAKKNSWSNRAFKIIEKISP